jgi:hypothetical protein
MECGERYFMIAALTPIKPKHYTSLTHSGSFAISRTEIGGALIGDVRYGQPSSSLNTYFVLMQLSNELYSCSMFNGDTRHLTN